MVLVILLIMVITVVILVRLVFGIFSPGCVWPILPAVLALPIVFIFTQGSFIKGSLIGSHGVVDLAEIKALFSYLGRFYFTLDLSFSYVHNIKGFVDSCELISKTIDVSVEVIDSET